MDKGHVALTGTPKEVFSDEKRLTDIGLSLPPVSYLMHRLNERNADIKADIMDIDAACREIQRFLGEKG